jgi:predicted peptidase
VEVDGASYAYRVFVPDGWSPEEQWPVILFLHGLGERGSDGTEQLSRGLPARIREAPDFPAVVVMPQCRRGAWWGDPTMETMAFQALEASMEEFRGDPERVYLTGLSMGGYGAWAFGYKYPEKFAAIVPVCGGVYSRGSFTAPDWHPLSRAPEDPYRETASGIGAVPVWAFHGEADRRVPVSESRELVRALEEAGGNVRYTEYPGVGHQSWNLAYWEEDLLPWLLSQEKAPAGDGGQRR